MNFKENFSDYHQVLEERNDRIKLDISTIKETITALNKNYNEINSLKEKIIKLENSISNPWYSNSNFWSAIGSVGAVIIAIFSLFYTE